jgi:hypothetical protein
MRARRWAAVAALLLLVVLAAGIWWAVRGAASWAAARSEEAVAAVRAWQPGGLNGVGLGQFVDDIDSAGDWTASRQSDGSFEVSLSYVPYAPWSDERRVAVWRYQAASGVVATNAEARQLTDEAASRKW